MNTRVLLIIAFIAVGLVLPSSGGGLAIPALSVIIPIEYALFKLKAAAIAGLLYLSQGGSYHHNIDIGHGWRRRRDVSALETPEKLEIQVTDASVDDVLQYDQLGCGMRLVCELAATPEPQLLEDEKLMLKLFGNDEKIPANPSKASRAKLSYSYAALLGAEAKTVDACARVYGRCPYTAQQVMQTIRAASA